jgi:hypothetical protein
MNSDIEYLGALISSISTLLFCMALFLAGLVAFLRYVEEKFRRFRRWRRRRAQRPVFPKARVLREGVQVKLRVDADASTLRQEAAGLTEDWPQHETEVDAWVSAGTRNVPAD